MTRITTIVGLGELLWDVFPDGPRLGGAPANFARNAVRIGRDSVNACVVSGVGKDVLGQQTIESLAAFGVDTSCISVQDRPTGQVFVALDNQGSASYEFEANTAWDHLAWSNELEQLALRTDAVCFGTLGQRSEVSCETIRRFLSTTSPASLRICDINLRPPFFNDSIILESLTLANVVKLNDEELLVVASVCGFSGTTVQIIQQLASRFNLRMVALTCGADGSVLFCDNRMSKQLAMKTKVVDTVGAGDAFTATLALGMLAEHTLDVTNQNASRVASFVCSQPDAAPKMPKYLQVFNRVHPTKA